MPYFSRVSKDRLATCHDDLRKICNLAIQVFDFTVVCGFRNKEGQEKAFQELASTKHWPDSKHNTSPSLAVDIAPYKNKAIVWKEDAPEWKTLITLIKGIALTLDIKIECGADWKNFIDKPHIQLKKQ